jgi:long-chain acyl-CoA synthetase
MAVVISGARTRTHQEIEQNALRAAAGFRALGVSEGDAVALLLRNDLAFFEASRGAVLAGAYPVPLNWHGTAAEQNYILRDCGAKLLVAHADLVPETPDGMTVIVVDTPREVAAAYRVAPGKARGIGWDAFLAGHDALAVPAAAERAAVIYTSGTTGRPKGVKRAPVAKPQGSPRAMQVYGFDEAGTGGNAPRVLINGPLYHSVPNAYSRLALRAGADIVLQPKFDAEDLLALIEAHRITHMHIVPTMFVRLLRLQNEIKVRYDISSLRYVVHGAAPCPPAVKAAMIAWWGQVIYEYYGSTETGLLTRLTPEEAAAKPGSVGRALPGITIKILDPDGGELPPGDGGDVYAGSDTMHGFTYIGQAEKRAEIGRGDLVTAGDIGRLDAEGYLYLSDRKRDTIISGGIKIYPAEIEAVLVTLPAVKDCAVFGIPDEEFGEAVCAFIEPVAGSDMTAEGVRAALNGRLERAKLPWRVEIVANLPREDSGKIFKQKLRASFWPAPG